MEPQQGPPVDERPVADDDAGQVDREEPVPRDKVGEAVGEQGHGQGEDRVEPLVPQV